MSTRALAFAAALPVVVASGFVSVVAWAADGPTFDALDKDKDGLITASEARADPTVAARFAAFDKNQDGYLSRSEFDALRGR